MEGEVKWLMVLAVIWGVLVTLTFGILAGYLLILVRQFEKLREIVNHTCQRTLAGFGSIDAKMRDTASMFSTLRVWYQSSRDKETSRERTRRLAGVGNGRDQQQRRPRRPRYYNPPQRRIVTGGPSDNANQRGNSAEDQRDRS